MVQVGSAAGVPTGFRFVEWGSVIAGAVMAAALSFVFLTFGSAIGLSAVSPWPDAGVSAKTAASLAVFWTLAQQIGAFMVGGYIAGRMRTRWAEANADETEFRDGLHGALVWAVGIVIGALLFLSTAGAIAKTGADAVAKAATVAGANADSISYYADALMRPAPRPAAPTAQGTTKRHVPRGKQPTRRVMPPFSAAWSPQSVCSCHWRRHGGRPRRAAIIAITGSLHALWSARRCTGPQPNEEAPCSETSSFGSQAFRSL
jgi:hypothetical protein